MELLLLLLLDVVDAAADPTNGSDEPDEVPLGTNLLVVVIFYYM